MFAIRFAKIELSLPQTHLKTLEFEGEGVQTYEARPNPEERGKFVWWPKESTADLVEIDAASDKTNRPIPKIRLSEGSVWSASDGSSAVGQIEKTALAPETNSAAWVLFKVIKKSNQGAVSKLSYIQRVHTHAGTPPATPPERMGQIARVPYYAQYRLCE